MPDLAKQQHPEWLELRQFFDDIDLLYRGGWAIRQQAQRFLVPRPMEPSQVYSARLARFSYQNILGTALGWYVSALFAEAPHLAIEPEPGDDLAQFLEDADRRGRSIAELARDWFRSAALDGAAYVLLDLPSGAAVATLAEQRAAGALRPYLVSFERSQLRDWSLDATGAFEWVLLYTESRARRFGASGNVIDRWYYFDREAFRVYEAARPEDQKAPAPAQLVQEGPHALADLGEVPLYKMAVPEDLWIGSRVYPQVLDHLNQDNSLGWALHMANLAVPVIAGDYEEPPKLSETSYIKLEKGATFTWSEPAGTSFEQSARRVDTLREEIYRQMYLQAQGRTSTATAAASSGYSKELDMMPAREVLNGYGAILRQALSDLIGWAAAVLGREVSVEVTGYQFDEGEGLDEIETAEAALALDIPSETWRRHVQRRIVRRYSNPPPDVLAQIDREIEAAPSAAERARAEREARAGEFAARLGA